MSQIFIGDLTIKSEMKKLVDLVWQGEEFEEKFSLKDLQPGWEIFFFYKNKPRHILIPFDFEYSTLPGREQIKSDVRRELTQIISTQD